MRRSAAWVIVWGICISSAAAVENDSPLSRQVQRDQFAMVPAMNLAAPTGDSVTGADRAPIEAPMPAAFWQGLACLTLVLAGWRVCRTVAVR
jgi:hypothetical protein